VSCRSRKPARLYQIETKGCENFAVASKVAHTFEGWGLPLLKMNSLGFGTAIAQRTNVTKKVQAQEKMIDPRFLCHLFSPFRHTA
jgi:hypothetical protein